MWQFIGGSLDLCRIDLEKHDESYGFFPRSLLKNQLMNSRHYGIESHPWQQACQVLQQGGVIVYPTESFYALGVCMTQYQACQRLLRIKKRGAVHPVALIAASLEAVQNHAQFNDATLALAQSFWPGPLTLGVRMKPSMAETLHPSLFGPTGHVGVRVSAWPLAQRLTSALVSGHITATSANISGQQPVRSVEDLPSALLKEVDWVVDGGLLTGGPVSTILMPSAEGFYLYRQGAITSEAIQKVLGPQYPLKSFEKAANNV